MTGTVSFAVHEGVAVALIEHPPVNALSHGVRAGLLAALACASPSPIPASGFPR